MKQVESLFEVSGMTPPPEVELRTVHCLHLCLIHDKIKSTCSTGRLIPEKSKRKPFNGDCASKNSPIGITNGETPRMMKDGVDKLFY